MVNAKRCFCELRLTWLVMVHTRFAELVDLKNQNPLRGYNHRSPLEIIELGDIERLMLEQQGYTPDDILPEGVKIDLRRNF